MILDEGWPSNRSAANATLVKILLGKRRTTLDIRVCEDQTKES